VDSLYDADALVVRHTTSSLVAGTCSYEIADRAGLPLASVRQEASRPTTMIGRLFSDRPGMRAADLDVLDPSGTRMFGIAKARSRFGALALAVSLADGHPLGFASSTSRRRTSLFDASNAMLGAMRRVSPARTTVSDPSGTEVGAVERDLPTRCARGAGQSDTTSYQVRFAGNVSQAVRVMALAVVITANLQHAM
jgi:hypothetical protein